LKIGIVGYGYSGKTTVFALLAGLGEAPGDTGDPVRVAEVEVPDPRLDEIARAARPPRVTPASVQVLDLVGHYHEEGEALEEQYAPRLTRHMPQAEAWVHVVRAFATDEFVPSRESADPADAVLNLELHFVLHDLSLVERRLERMAAEKGKGVRHEPAAESALEKCRAALLEERPLRGLELEGAEEAELRGFHLLSRKPVLVLVNLPEDAREEEPGPWSRACEERGLPWVSFPARLELEIAQLPAEERGPFLRELGIEEPARERFLRRVFPLLGRTTFFTVSEKELRAWAVPEGTTASGAAGAIHSDMERGFIRAEVIGYHDFVRVGGYAPARKAGLLRLEGKDYPVKDGEILLVRFSV
jgi:ribosome-binding ATPase YchF (GTP1/OBG family)